MQERDLRAADAGARRLVDQPHARVAQLRRARRRRRRPGRPRGAGPGPRLARKRPTGVSSRERREQLHVALADVEQRGLDALLGDRLAVHERHAVGVAVEGDRRVEVLDRDPDVVDAAEHAGRVYPQRPCASPSPPTAPPAAGSTPSRWRPRCARAAPRSPCSAARATSSSAQPRWGPDRLGGRRRRRDDRPGRPSWPGRLDVPLAVHPDRDGERLRARLRAARATRARRRALAADGRRSTRAARARAPRRRPPVRQRRQRRASPRWPRAAPQPLKSRLGPLAYGVGALRAAATRARRCRSPCAPTGGRVFDDDAWQVIVAVSGAFGGGSGDRPRPTPTTACSTS